VTLPGNPIRDGLAIAGGTVFVALADGRVIALQ
jgi:hypothetical protein